MLYQNLDVPDPTPESADGGAIYWSFLLVNAGHPDNSSLVSAITSATDAVAGALIGTGNVVAVVVGGTLAGTDLLVRLLTNGCDGVVAAQNWAFTAAQLATMAGGGKRWNSEQNYPGTSSPVQCGRPSSYNVNYTITSQAAVSVPKILGESPEDAKNDIQKAGLSLGGIRHMPGDIESPMVMEQYPAPGTLVLNGSAVSLLVETPRKMPPR